MSEILTPEKLAEVLDRAIYADSYEHDRGMVLAHDAALRSENERLREALHGLIDERDPATLKRMAAVLRLAGRTVEATACEALAALAPPAPEAGR